MTQPPLKVGDARQSHMKELMAISEDISKENGAAEERLRAKCQWEHMTRTAVINEWGDPRKWRNL